MNIFVPQTREIDKFLSWKKDPSSALLLLGMAGTGKTTFARYLERRFQIEDDLKLNIGTLDEVYYAVNNDKNSSRNIYWIDQNEINILGNIDVWSDIRRRVFDNKLKLVVSTRQNRTKRAALPLSQSDSSSPVFNFFSVIMELNPFSVFEIESGKITNIQPVLGLPDENESKLSLIVSSLTTRKLIDALRQQPEILRNLPPRVFEEVIAELLDSFGYQVELTKSTRDGGYDILAKSKDYLGNFEYLVECKRFAENNKVDVNIARALFGTVMHNKANGGIIVTTSSFTGPAIQFQKEVPLQLQFNDFEDIKQWLEIA